MEQRYLESELNKLVVRYGFSEIPTPELRACPCPDCGKKCLSYARHRSVLNLRDRNRIKCNNTACLRGFSKKLDRPVDLSKYGVCCV